MVMIQARRTGKNVSLAKYWYPWKHIFWCQFYSAKYWKLYFLMPSSTYLVFLPSCTGAGVWRPCLRSWRSRIAVGTASQWLAEQKSLIYMHVDPKLYDSFFFTWIEKHPWLRSLPHAVSQTHVGELIQAEDRICLTPSLIMITVIKEMHFFFTKHTHKTSL